MKKKYGVHWILAGVVALSLMTQYSAIAADKVVVIPLFSSSDEIPMVKTKTGEVWMDRNLGAIRVAGSKSDSLAYGWLYQWGRPADGHESRTSPETLLEELSPGDIPGHGQFIITNTAPPLDWTSTPNNHLWEGATGVNNPCPPGFRIPTIGEWQAELDTWDGKNAEGAFGSKLKLTVGGHRKYWDGEPYQVGTDGFYWASDDDGSYATSLHIISGGVGFVVSPQPRAYGFSVRCIKD